MPLGNWLKDYIFLVPLEVRVSLFKSHVRRESGRGKVRIILRKKLCKKVLRIARENTFEYIYIHIYDSIKFFTEILKHNSIKINVNNYDSYYSCKERQEKAL